MSATVRFPAHDEFRDDRAPEWARRYRGGDYPYVGLAADLVALCLSPDAAHLDALTIARAAAPFAGRQALPGGFLDWLTDHDIEDTARREAREETGVEAPAFLEKLDTFAENGRDPRQWAGRQRGDEWEAVGVRIASVAYLAVFDRAERPAPVPADDAEAAAWEDVYAILPWEDTRAARWLPSMRAMVPELEEWARGARAEERVARLTRIEAAFGKDRRSFRTWNEETCELRFRVLREAGLLPESHRDKWGEPRGAPRGEPRGEPPIHAAFLDHEMAFDHRLILAVALGRVRGKIKYVPALLASFVGGASTMAELHQALETLSGRHIHRANLFRVLVESRRLVEPLEARGPRKPGQRGASPTLYRFRPAARAARLDPSMRVPWRPVGWPGGEGRRSRPERRPA